MKINIQSNEFRILMFFLAAIVAFVSVLSEMTCATYADDTAVSESADGYFNVCDYTEHDNGTSKSIPDNVLSFKGGNLKNVACYVTKNYRTDKDGTILDRYTFITSLALPVTIKRELWKGFLDQGKVERDSRVSSQNTSAVAVEASEASVHCYVFSDESKVNAYLRGEIDAKEAENYDDLINDKGDYDESLPYYGMASVDPIDSNKFTMQFTARMSTQQIKNLYNLRNEGYELYYTYESYGIYMKSDIWTSLSRIFETMGLSSSFSQKVKENITIDSSGRLVVGKAYSGGGGRHSGSLFKTLSSNTCNVYSVEMEGTVATSDKLSCGQDYTKELSAKVYNDIDAGDLLFGINGGAKLIGYYVIIQPYIIKDGTIVYAKPTYAYNWCYKCLRDALGNGAYSYDPTNPDEPVDPVNPPDKGDPVPDPDDPDPVVPTDPTTFDLVGYLQTCMKEAKSFILLYAMYLDAVPGAIWALVIAGMTLNLLIIAFKIVRGM